jgi:uncharacterized protein (TIGR03435 family)
VQAIVPVSTPFAVKDETMQTCLRATNGFKSNCLRTLAPGLLFLVFSSNHPEAQQQHQAALVSARTGATAAAFDVASIRPTDPSTTGFSISPSPTSLRIRGAPVRFLIEYAYDLHDFQLEGGPSWIKTARFDIIGKMDAPPQDGPTDWPATKQLLQLRLQTLLGERFNLHFHRAIRDLPVYKLRVAKSGSRLVPATKDTGYTQGRGLLRCSSSSLSTLAAMLADSLDRTVVDETHLPGYFSFDLRWNPDDDAGADSQYPNLFSAIEEQLGLKIVAGKGPVDVLAIDTIDLPSPN